jgi:hypothetical protein
MSTASDARCGAHTPPRKCRCRHQSGLPLRVARASRRHAQQLSIDSCLGRTNGQSRSGSDATCSPRSPEASSRSSDTPYAMNGGRFSRPAGKGSWRNGRQPERICLTRRRCPRPTVLATAGRLMYPVCWRVSPSKLSLERADHNRSGAARAEAVNVHRTTVAQAAWCPADSFSHPGPTYGADL